MNDSIIQFAINAAERGLIPDSLIRTGIRSGCKHRLKADLPFTDSECKDKVRQFAESMRKGPIAFQPEKANEQHYEMPAEFMALAMGPRRKYSCCFWPANVSNLADAEIASLKQVFERAKLQDGMSVLELGCGWGSFSLWLAEQCPNCSITAVSNSSLQRHYIESVAAERGFKNLTVITQDINDFQATDKFDRVVSIEMFEHLWNYQEILHRISTWLKPDGLMFLHIFTHLKIAYRYSTEGAGNWMGKHFFTAGIMPAHDLLDHFSSDLKLSEKWHLDGTHYEKTSNAWLAHLDNHKSEAIRMLSEILGATEGRFQYQRWRLFYLACAELFGFRNGTEWGVSHYLLQRVDR